VTRDRGDDQGEMGTWAENARRKCQPIIPTAIQLLGPAKASWPTIKATIGFIRNIAHDKKVLKNFIQHDPLNNFCTVSFINANECKKLRAFDFY